MSSPKTNVELLEEAGVLESAHFSPKTQGHRKHHSRRDCSPD